VNAIETPNDTVWLVIIAALIGAIVAFIGAMIYHACRPRFEVDQALRDSRLKCYKPLWTQSQLPHRWYKTEPFNSERATQLSEALNTWYFGEGGIYLSTPARRAYQQLQAGINRFVEYAKDMEAEQKKGSDAEPDDDGEAARRKERAQEEIKSLYNAIGKSCGRLRNELNRDVLTRSKISRPR
jgi:hypothetical protein